MKYDPNKPMPGSKPRFTEDLDQNAKYSIERTIKLLADRSDQHVMLMQTLLEVLGDLRKEIKTLNTNFLAQPKVVQSQSMFSIPKEYTSSEPLPKTIGFLDDDMLQIEAALGNKNMKVVNNEKVIIKQKH